MPATIETSIEERTCGACAQVFPSVAEVFSHPCPEIHIRHARFVPPVGPVDVVPNPAAAGRRSSSTSAPVRRNRYAGPCSRCGATVPAEAGLLSRDAGSRQGGWLVVHDGPCPETVVEPAERVVERPARTNRFDAPCRRCSATVPAGTGALSRGENGWVVDHVGECPERVESSEPGSDGYEPQRGDVHVVDGAYYRVHVSQRSGRFYVVRCEIVEPAVWGDDGELVEAGVIEWDYDGAKGMLRRLSTSTLASAEAAAAFGKLVGRCCFCSTPIDTPQSTKVGYGPKCASDRGLPWGE